MTWDCAQLEQRLSDYLDGRLTPAEQAGADAHARVCPRCADQFLARQATGWLRQLEPLESPPGLETRILALTVAPPPRESLWAVLQSGWRAFQQPRVALGVAAAVFSIALVLNAFDVSTRDIRFADLNPGNLYRGAKRHAHLTYARGTRFVNDLRLVYEIRSRLEALQTETETPPAATPETHPASPSPEKNSREETPQDGASSQWLLACQNLIALGELR